MAKAYTEMTPEERTRDRIAKNHRIEESVLSGAAGLTLEAIVSRLNARKQRATYKAVADLVGVLPMGLMTGRSKEPRYSWVVAATSGRDSQRGFPTGYSVSQIHPDCHRQICEGEENIIESGEILKEWLSRKD